MGVLVTPPTSYSLFFPDQKSKRKSDVAPVEKSQKIPKLNTIPSPTSTTPTNGFLTNSGDKVLPPHARMSVNLCYDRLVNGKCNYPGCRLFHGIFPKDYSKPDRIVMSSWVKDTPALSWKPAAKAALDRVQASED